VLLASGHRTRRRIDQHLSSRLLRPPPMIHGALPEGGGGGHRQRYPLSASLRGGRPAALRRATCEHMRKHARRWGWGAHVTVRRVFGVSRARAGWVWAKKATVSRGRNIARQHGGTMPPIQPSPSPASSPQPPPNGITRSGFRQGTPPRGPLPQRETLGPVEV
jgi:hypothetical protein